MWEKLKFFVSAVYEFLKRVIAIFMSEVGALLAKVAMEAVKMMMNKDIPNSEKRDAAFEYIKGELLSKGIAIGSSVIYLAIEIAVQKLKEIQGKD